MKAYIVMESVYNANGHLSTEPIGAYKKHQSAVSKIEEIYLESKKHDTEDASDEDIPGDNNILTANVSFDDLFYDDVLTLDIDEEIYRYKIKAFELKN